LPEDRPHRLVSLHIDTANLPGPIVEIEIACDPCLIRLKLELGRSSFTVRTTGSAGATTSPGHATTTTTTLQLGPLILRVPATWRITYRDAQGDYTVSTGACAGDDLVGAEAGSPCPAFSLIADAGPTSSPAGDIGTHAYVPGQEYTTSTGATGCPAKPATSWLRDAPVRPYSSGYAPVTSTRTADYTVWQFGCYHAAGAPSFYFQQRDWYLPDSRILIVDEYATPGLAQILATATWAG